MGWQCIKAQEIDCSSHLAKSQRQASGVISAPTTCTTAPPARQPSRAHLGMEYPRMMPYRKPAAKWSPAPANPSNLSDRARYLDAGSKSAVCRGSDEQGA